MKDNQIYNRELSWLQFNNRVLQEAQDRSVPLMQRLRFLGIYSNNKDEYMKVRVANLVRYSKLKPGQIPKITGGYDPQILLKEVNESISKSQRILNQTYNEILKEMKSNGVNIVNERDLTKLQQEFCKEYFLSTVSVRLIPLILRKSTDIPFLSDDKAYLAVEMTGQKGDKFAILDIPTSESCPRFVVLPTQSDRVDVIFLDDIIRLFLNDIFFMFNYVSISAHTFRLIRDAELSIDDDVSKTYIEKMSQGITKRQKGHTVRLIYDKDMPQDMLMTIANKLGFRSFETLEPGGRYHMLRDLMKFPKVRKDLERKISTPLHHPLIDPFDSILKVISKQDILLAYPYHTFNHFIDFLREAAVDARVSAISISLYRTANNSKVINALLSAAKNGKQVTVLIELKARFSEEQNIMSTAQLQAGGVKVIHSVDGLKVHGKLVLIEKNEGARGKQGYVYIGTGNFNESTSATYTDFGFFTSDPVFIEDARRVFDFLQNTHIHPNFKELIVSPYYMRDKIVEMINVEIKRAKQGKPAYFYGKFNSLTDEKMLMKLYEASQAGVKIKLLIRGACCLKVGIKKLSENIKVRSIIDKYLEHARMIICCNDNKPNVLIMSADLMTRNLDRRVEVGCFIKDKTIKDTLIDYFDIQWQDNQKAREIKPPYENGYHKMKDGEEPCRCQDILYKYFNNMNNA